MKIALYCLIGFGVLLCATSIIINWLMFDYRAAVIGFSGMLAMIGIFVAFNSLDRFGDDEANDESNND